MSSHRAKIIYVLGKIFMIKIKKLLQPRYFYKALKIPVAIALYDSQKYA